MTNPFYFIYTILTDILAEGKVQEEIEDRREKKEVTRGHRVTY
jgi:hypothetical protein